jgi:hypothetical protein
MVKNKNQLRFIGLVCHHLSNKELGLLQEGADFPLESKQTKHVQQYPTFFSAPRQVSSFD